MRQRDGDDWVEKWCVLLLFNPILFPMLLNNPDTRRNSSKSTRLTHLLTPELQLSIKKTK